MKTLVLLLSFLCIIYTELCGSNSTLISTKNCCIFFEILLFVVARSKSTFAKISLSDRINCGMGKFWLLVSEKDEYHARCFIQFWLVNISCSNFQKIPRSVLASILYVQAQFYRKSGLSTKLAIIVGLISRKICQIPYLLYVTSVPNPN